MTIFPAVKPKQNARKGHFQVKEGSATDSLAKSVTYYVRDFRMSYSTTNTSLNIQHVTECIATISPAFKPT